MYRLVPTLIREMGLAFPELVRAEALITETLKLEEMRFKKTLDRGLKLLDEEVARLPEKGVLDGNVAFRLYDTYGFPLDLTQDALRAQEMSVDEDAFKEAMEKQKAEARAAWKGSGSEATEEIWFEAREQHGATEFLGYNTLHSEGQIVHIVKDDKSVQKAVKGDQIALLTNQSPFYGESGGQRGDMGILTSANGVEISITDTAKKLGALHVHMGIIISGEIEVGQVVDMKVDENHHNQLKANHSATHILHAALRNILGDHVSQKGSLVASDKLRFDISHNKAVSPEQIKQLEMDVNRVIRQNAAVITHLKTPEEAMKSGAMALFGEKYGDEVRVVSMGSQADAEGDFSVELCGGTHVMRTGDIGTFKITSESAVASGVRRLEAVTGQAAIDYSAIQEEYLLEAVAVLKTTPNGLTERIKTLMLDRKAAEKEISELRKKLALGGAGSSGNSDIREIGDVKFIGQVLKDVPAKDLRGLADEAKTRLGSGVVALIGVNEGKAAVLTAVTDDLKDRINAVDLVRAGAAAVGGKGGGGRPDMAQAGGPDGSKADAALKDIEKLIAEK